MIMNKIDKRLILPKEMIEEGKQFLSELCVIKESVKFGLFVSLLSASIFLLITSSFDYFKINSQIRVWISMLFFLIILFFFLKKTDRWNGAIKNLNRVIEQSKKYHLKK